MKKPGKSKLAILGLMAGAGFIVLAMAESGDLGLFINLPSLYMIVGGTAAYVVVSTPLATLKTFGAVVRKVFQKQEINYVRDIETIVTLSETARREGLLALESSVEQVDDDFLRKGVMLLMDGHGRKTIASVLINDIRSSQRRHKQGASMLGMIASTAPALGLVGTYVGLIPMLTSVTDPDALGPLMAIELVSSFYGAFLANIIFAPMNNRLKLMSADEKVRKELLLEGILEIEQGTNPRQIRENLMSYLTKKEIDILGAYSKNRETAAPARKPVEEAEPVRGEVVNFGSRR